MHFKKTQEILNKTTLEVVNTRSNTTLSTDDGSWEFFDSICFDNQNESCFWGAPPKKYYHFLDIYGDGIQHKLRTAISSNPIHQYQENNLGFYSRVVDVVSDLKQGKYLSEQYSASALTPDQIGITRFFAMNTFKEIFVFVFDDVIFIEKKIEIEDFDDFDTRIISKMDDLERATNIIRGILNC